MQYTETVTLIHRHQMFIYFQLIITIRRAGGSPQPMDSRNSRVARCLPFKADGKGRNGKERIGKALVSATHAPSETQKHDLSFTVRNLVARPLTH